LLPTVCFSPAWLGRDCPRTFLAQSSPTAFNAAGCTCALCPHAVHLSLYAVYPSPHRLSLSARCLRRPNPFGCLQPINTPNTRFPAAETLQGAVGVQRLAHGHDHEIVSLTCTLVPLLAPTSATLDPFARLCIHWPRRHDSQLALAACSTGQPATRRRGPAPQNHEDVRNRLLRAEACSKPDQEDSTVPTRTHTSDGAVSDHVCGQARREYSRRHGQHGRQQRPLSPAQQHVRR
jgi:hypothetical protein